MIDESSFEISHKSIKESIMTKNKTQIWNEVKELLIEEKKGPNSKLYKELQSLLEPKTKGASLSNPPKEIDGELHFHCRYTDEWFPKSETIFQNDEKRDANKSKGYSKLGISLWNKGQKMMKAKKEELFDLMMSGSEDHDKMAELKDWIANTDVNTVEFLSTLREES